MVARHISRGERLTQIERLLLRSSQGLRAMEIAGACGVDRRTIYRDLNLLEKLGVPVTQEDGRFFINRDYYLTSVRLNFNEAVALFVAGRFFSRHAEQHNPHMISVLNKLHKAMPEPVADHVKYVAEWIRGNPVDRNYVQVLEAIIRAWVESRKIHLWTSTSKAGEIQTIQHSVYFIEPASSGGLYAVGWDDFSEGVKAVKVEWIKRVRLLDESYDIPANFDRRPYLESVWGILGTDTVLRNRVILAFSPDVTSLIRERLWHASQQIATLPDKRCTLTLHVSEWRDLLPWIRSWGPQVEVLEPLALREELANEAERIAGLYQAIATSA
jgi:proteasome accessory factor B